nr:DUF3309 family protein [Rubinisphaera italica]
MSLTQGCIVDFQLLRKAISTILLIILILLLLGAIPAWPHSRNWGYAPVAALVWLF